MTPPAEAVARRADLIVALAKTAISASIVAVPGDLTVWAAALGADEYQAWRHPSGDITVTVVGQRAGRQIRVTAVFATQPAFMTRDQAVLPAFDSPAPAAWHTFPEAA